MRGWVAPLALLLLAAVSGCTAEATSADTSSPFAKCATSAGGSAPAGGSAAVGGSASVASASPEPVRLPDLRLPCFTGGAVVALRDVRGPAVINLWASWCGPCRRELPVMQRLADAAGDRLTVLGVDSGDRREAGASFAADKGVVFPTLFDEDSKLLAAVRRINLPVTLFVDASGRAFLYDRPLDGPKLTEMVRAHTGVTVTL